MTGPVRVRSNSRVFGELLDGTVRLCASPPYAHTGPCYEDVGIRNDGGGGDSSVRMMGTRKSNWDIPRIVFVSTEEYRGTAPASSLRPRPVQLFLRSI